MIKNMGKYDKVVRIIIAILSIALYFGNIVTGTWGIVLLVVAAILVFTSLMGTCPIYAIFGYSTCPVKESSSK